MDRVYGIYLQRHTRQRFGATGKPPWSTSVSPGDESPGKQRISDEEIRAAGDLALIWDLYFKNKPVEKDPSYNAVFSIGHHRFVLAQHPGKYPRYIIQSLGTPVPWIIYLGNINQPSYNVSFQGFGIGTGLGKTSSQSLYNTFTTFIRDTLMQDEGLIPADYSEVTPLSDRFK